MGVQNAFKYGGIGLTADIMAPRLTGGKGIIFGAIMGLLAPDAAKDTDQAYEPPKDTGFTQFGNFTLPSELFGQGPRTDENGEPVKQGGMPFWAKLALGGVASMLMFTPAAGGGFGNPLYMFTDQLMNYGVGLAIPQLWQQGYTQNWAWTMPFLT